jgi:hypothetical protein
LDFRNLELARLRNLRSGFDTRLLASEINCSSKAGEKTTPTTHRDAAPME